jgi:hypothetical protein
MILDDFESKPNSWHIDLINPLDPNLSMNIVAQKWTYVSVSAIVIKITGILYCVALLLIAPLLAHPLL